jgi:hypothetical protein
MLLHRPRDRRRRAKRMEQWTPAYVPGRSLLRRRGTSNKRGGGSAWTRVYGRQLARVCDRGEIAGRRTGESGGFGSRLPWNIPYVTRGATVVTGEPIAAGAHLIPALDPSCSCGRHEWLQTPKPPAPGNSRAPVPASGGEHRPEFINLTAPRQHRS